MKLKMLFVVVLGYVLTVVCFSETMLKPKFLFEFGQKGSGDGEFHGPKDVAIDYEGKVYVLDEERIFVLEPEPHEILGLRQVQVFTSNGVFLAKFSSTNFLEPNALAVARLGNVYVTDTEADCVHVFDKDFQYVQKIGSTGNGDGQLNRPGQIAVDGGDKLYVVDRDNHRVAKFDSVGSFLTNFSIPGPAWDLEGITMHVNGFYVSGISGENYMIKSFDFLGNFLGDIPRQQKNGFVDIAEYKGGYVMGSGLIEGSTFSAVDGEDGPNAEVFMSFEGLNSIYIYSPTNYVTKFGSAGSESGQFIYSQGLATSPNEKDPLYISDYGNQRVQVFTFETVTNFSLIPPGGIYSSGDFDGDGLGDILVDRKRKGKRQIRKASFLQVKNGALGQMRNIAMSIDATQRKIKNAVGRILVGNSVGIYSSIVFKHVKQFRVATYLVTDAMLGDELQEIKKVPVPFKIGHVRASGDVNKDGILDIILTKKQKVKVLLGPDYTAVKSVTGLPVPLPGRVRAMYHEGSQDSVLVFQKGKAPGKGYFINSGLVATKGPQIKINQRILAMSGSTPVIQKKRAISMGNFTYKDTEPKKEGKLRVVGPR